MATLDVEPFVRGLAALFRVAPGEGDGGRLAPVRAVSAVRGLRGGARLRAMERWDMRGLPWRPHNPEILSSSEQGRAIVLDLPAGETLQDHQVHEGAWMVVVDGAVTVTEPDGLAVEAEPGMLVYVAPKERHEVTATTDARMLLLLTPWPGPGHPGTMTLEQKADVRDRAAERAQ